MLIRFFYELLLIIIGIAYLPFCIYQLIFKGKYRKSLFQRLGGGFPLINKGKRPLIWIHAVSFGETKAVSALAGLIKEAYDNPMIVFSSTTETGHQEACRTISADYHVYLPFDFGWIIRPIIKHTAPDLVIICESDFWYNFLSASKEAGAFIALVNGKVSLKSLGRFKALQPLSTRLFACIDLFCVQSDLYLDRFASLGIALEKLVTTGNMKYDGDFPKLSQVELISWQKKLGIHATDRVVVIGSSHSPEESQILSFLPKVWDQIPDLKVLLVPRHPERFNEVDALLQKSGIPFRRLSQNDAEKSAAVILIDAMGLLRQCYQLADVAIVCGSFTSKVGGHNILEPSWYGIPTLFGPEMFSQPDMVNLILEYRAGIQVTIEELPNMLIELLKDESRRKALSIGGLKLAADVCGATAKTLAVILKRSS